MSFRLQDFACIRGMRGVTLTIRHAYVLTTMHGLFVNGGRLLDAQLSAAAHYIDTAPVKTHSRLTLPSLIF